MRESGDVIVVGAGLIGLAIAFELAERGASVRVYDRAQPARAASWAAAGLLAPYSETLRDPWLLPLCESSLREYPAFVQRVRDAGSVDPRFHSGEVLHAAFTQEQGSDLLALYAAFAERSVRCEMLDRSQILTTEPWIGHDVIAGLLVRDEGWVDNRRLGRALVSACERRGVRVMQTSAVRVECDGRRVLGVASDFGFVAAGAVVNACGAWAAALEGVPKSCVPPVTPVKGQMLALGVPDGFVRRASWLGGVYLVPRDDGRLLVGATVESAGFDDRVTAGGMNTLLHAALRAAPSLGGFSITETWAGLRPGTPDGLPFLGATSLQGFVLATGHYRNGVLLAPVTARLLAEAIEGKAPAELRPFSIERAHAEESRSARTTHA
ncbi:MAG TPA: glycine oxidase ThiO [Candidatus Cybelea sp.]|jgi:glycine oxidase